MHSVVGKGRNICIVGRSTPPPTIMEVDNGPLEDYVPLPGGGLSTSMIVGGGWVILFASVDHTAINEPLKAASVRPLR